MSRRHNNDNEAQRATHAADTYRRHSFAIESVDNDNAQWLNASIVVAISNNFPRL
jgi:hypothetical protein